MTAQHNLLRSIYHSVPYEVWVLVFTLLAMVGGLTVSFAIAIFIDILYTKVGELFENIRKRCSSHKKV